MESKFHECFRFVYIRDIIDMLWCIFLLYIVTRTCILNEFLFLLNFQFSQCIAVHSRFQNVIGCTNVMTN